jgi:hypothetical protein
MNRTAKENLTELLADGRAVNMIQVYRSRTGRKRGYRLFATNHLQRVEDVTAFVCKAIGHEWNNVKGTYETSEPAFYGDNVTLCNRLSDVLDVGLVPVLIL